MRKLSLLLILTILSVVTARPAETVLYQGLTDDATGWNDDGGTWMWLDDCFDAEMGFVNGDGVGFYENTITLPSADETNITLTFNQATNGTIQGIYNQGCRIAIREVGAEDWTYFLPDTYDANGASDYTQAIASLNAYRGKNI